MIPKVAPEVWPPWFTCMGFFSCVGLVLGFAFEAWECLAAVLTLTTLSAVVAAVWTA